MIRIPFVARVAALACAFVVPVSAAIAFTLADNAQTQRVVHVEMRGAACFPVVYSNLLALETYRVTPSSVAALSVERSFASVEGADCVLGPKAWSRIRSAWPAARRDASQLPGLENQIVEYLQVVSVETNLSYEPYRAIADLADAVVYRLPGASMRFSLAATSSEPLESERFAASAEDRLHFGFDDLNAAVAEYPPYRARLDAPLQRAESSTQTYLAALERWEHADRSGGGATLIDERNRPMHAAVSALNALFSVSTSELQDILEQKLGVLEERRGTILAIATAAIALSIAIVLAITATIARRDRSQLSQAEARAALLQAELARKEAEDALHINEERFRSIFAASPLPMAITDLAGIVSECNEAYALLVSADDSPTGRRLLDPLAFDAPAELDAIFETLRSGSSGVRTADFPIFGRGGRAWYHAIVSSVRGADGGPSYCTVMLQDITERTNRERQLHHQATHDTMTGLPNRSFVTAALQRALERKRGGVRFALLFVDVDDFKTVNDSRGHAAGDDYLRIIAQRLNSCVRAGDIVARYGGDEFAILLDSLSSEADVDRIVLRMSREFAEPVSLAGSSLRPSLSVGIVVDDGMYASSSAALADADLAMYRAKARGGNCSVTFRRGWADEEPTSA